MTKKAFDKIVEGLVEVKEIFEMGFRFTQGPHPNDDGGMRTNGPEYRDVTCTHVSTGSSLTITVDASRSTHKARQAAKDGLHYALIQLGVL